MRVTKEPHRSRKAVQNSKPHHVTEYRRAHVPGASWFFTVNPAQRKENRFLVERIGLLRAAWNLPGGLGRRHGRPRGRGITRTMRFVLHRILLVGLLDHQLVIVSMAADPEPQNAISNVHTQRAAMETNADRPKTPGFFEMQRWMVRISL